MNIESKDIKLFDDLTDYNDNCINYDFHNDYDIIGLSLSQGRLLLKFACIKESKNVSIVFNDAEIMYLDFELITRIDNYTIDTLYRGRYEKNGKLMELSSDNKGYFYLELCEGYKIEFWSSSMSIKLLSSTS